jgi:hypothetical protein
MKLFGRWPVAGSVALVSFHKLTRYFCDPDLTDAFIDNALPVALDFQHDAVIIYGFHPMIAEILRRKNQKSFYFLSRTALIWTACSALKRPCLRLTHLSRTRQIIL